MLRQNIDQNKYEKRNQLVTFASEFFKHVENGIYEIRIEVGGNIYRIFSFFEANNILILLHAFQKKTQKN
ncbi:MAG TPA: hypothetical protein ENI20_17750 [Bacteroides sp.]|nr:hypothetical protein [Bacteroides sp.]